MCNCNNNKEHAVDNLKSYPSAFLQNIFNNDNIECKKVKSNIREILLDRHIKSIYEYYEGE